MSAPRVRAEFDSVEENPLQSEGANTLVCQAKPLIVHVEGNMTEIVADIRSLLARTFPAHCEIVAVAPPGIWPRKTHGRTTI